MFKKLHYCYGRSSLRSMRNFSWTYQLINWIKPSILCQWGDMANIKSYCELRKVLTPSHHPLLMTIVYLPIPLLFFFYLLSHQINVILFRPFWPVFYVLIWCKRLFKAVLFKCSSPFCYFSDQTNKTALKKPWGRFHAKISLPHYNLLATKVLLVQHSSQMTNPPK